MCRHVEPGAMAASRPVPFLQPGAQLSERDLPMCCSRFCQARHRKSAAAGMGSPGGRRRRRPFFSLLSPVLLLPLSSAYKDEGSECRSIRLDETTGFVSPAVRGIVSDVHLTDDKDLTPLLESDRSLGDSATLRFRALATNPLCVPSSLTIHAEKGALTIQVPTPQDVEGGDGGGGDGWQAGVWHDMSVAVTSKAYSSDMAWADLVSMQVGYACTGAASDSEHHHHHEDEQQEEGEEEGEGREKKKDAIKVELVRLCKRVPSPSYCLVESSDVYQSDCKDCHCKTCHSCACLIKLTDHCPYEPCDSCLGAPLIKCCFEADCGYPCQCDTCCESHSFLSCSKAIHYGIASISPTSGPQSGGNVVRVHARTSFADSPYATCRFDLSVVPARVLSANEIECTAPPHTGSDAASSSSASEGVAVQVSLDGHQWSTEDIRYRYCQPGSSCQVCGPGWKGANCTVECRGGSSRPCHGRGVCLEAPAGECECDVGYGGAACEQEVKAAASAEGGGGGNRSNGGGRGSTRAGVAIGVSICMAVLAVGGVVMYVKRQEVGELVFWSLASNRWQRLHQQGSPIDGPIPPHRRGRGATGRGGGGSVVGNDGDADDNGGVMMMETRAPPLPPSRAGEAGGKGNRDSYALLRLESHGGGDDDDDEGDVTML